MTHEGLPVESVALDSLRPHSRNYREHPSDQIEHVAASIREHGVYRPIVIARDGTILAGHGVVEALRSLGAEAAPCVRLDIAPDDPRALKLLVGDNEVGHLAVVHDRALSEVLRELREADPLAGLAGTGFDVARLDALLVATMPPSVEPPADFPEYGEDIETEHTCPKCGYAWSGGT